MEDVNLKHALGLSLLKKLCKDEKTNFVFSPLSLGTAFAMLVAGLKGDTKDEVITFLGGKNEDTLHKLYTGLVANKDLPLKIANKYVVQDKITVLSGFNDLLKSRYRSEVESADFVKEGKAVEKRINSWVSGKTNNMIPKLLPENSLTPDTILVLLNAVYFKGTWVEEFEPVPTKLDFTLRDGRVVKKDFMTKSSNKLRYHETEKLRLVKIPYNEAGCYMVVALPTDERKHIDDVLLETTPSDIASALNELNNSMGPPVDLTMPKFKIEYNFESVKDHMKQLGVNKIFQAGLGDFSNMFSNSEVEPKLCVAAIIHKAVIEVDEKGTEAAAATAIRMVLCSSSAVELLNIIFKMIGDICVSEVMHQSVVEVDEIGTRAVAATAIRIMARCGMMSDDILIDRPFYFGIYSGPNNSCLFQGVFRN